VADAGTGQAAAAGAGTGAPAAGAGQPAAAGAPSQNGANSGAGAAPTWMTGLSPEMTGYVQNKGFKDPGSVLESYVQLEKLMGAPKERLLRLPEKDDDPAWGDVYERLGKPKDAKEYAIKVPENMGDPKFADWARSTFHEIGLPKKQADALSSKWNDYIQSHSTQAKQTMQAKFQEQELGLRSEWGQAHEKNTQVAKMAAKEFGIDGDTLDKLESVLGFAGTMKFMHKIGSGLGEDRFVSPDGGNNFSGMMAPAQAQQKLNALKADPAWVAKYTAGDAAATAEVARLHKMMSPS
jgi:hypothetical protein